MDLRNIVIKSGASQVAQWQRIHLSIQEMQKMQVQSLVWEDPLEEEMVTNSSIFFFFQVESLLIYLFFNWRKMALPCCAGFCHTTMQISHNYRYMASLPSPYATPLDHQNARLGSLCYVASSHQLSILHMVVYICLCYFLHLSHSLLPLLCRKSILYIRVSIPSLQIGSSI